MRKYPLLVEWDLEPQSENIEVTPSVLAQSALYYLQAVGRFWAKKSYYTERELYHSFLLLYTRSGSGRLQYRGRSYSLRPGDVCLIDCKEHHYYRTDGDEIWELQWMHFQGGGSQGVAEHILKYAGPVQAAPADSVIPETLEQLLEAYRRPTIESDIVSNKRIVDILTELMIGSMGRASGSGAAGIPVYIAEMMDEMERNCAETIRLDDLAKQHNRSKFHLAREFKRYTGFSPNDYLIRLRISLSKELLKYSALSVEEIALRCGFQQASHFIKTFRLKEGVTPLAFRKMWR